jgi:hypothetical protein
METKDEQIKKLETQNTQLYKALNATKLQVEHQYRDDDTDFSNTIINYYITENKKIQRKIDSAEVDVIYQTG